MHKSSWTVVAVVMSLCGCAKETSQPSPPPVLSERMGLTVGTSALAVGGDCSAFEGSTGCRGGLVCLRLLPGFPSRGVCSQRCVDLVVTPSLDGGKRDWVQTECPTVNGVKWLCVQAMSTPDGMLCVPPGASFDAGARTMIAIGVDGGAP